MKFERTYNRAIDLCQDLIFSARQHNMPIKALHLDNLHYQWFKSGVQTLMNRELKDDEAMQLDGVNIEKGDRMQTKAVIIEYYPQKAEA